MLYTLIRGRFAPALGLADGDSIRFIPDDRALVEGLERIKEPADVNDGNGSINLRLQSVDAMERDARREGASPNEADAATARLLGVLGVPEGRGEAPGAVLARTLDEHGRPLAFIYGGGAGDPFSGDADGARLLLKADILQRSVNHLLVREGLCYPLYYEALPADLRTVLTWASCQAERSRLGVWAADASLSGARWRGPTGLKEMPPLFPKLWRRLRDYCNHRDFEADAERLKRFPDYLRLRADAVRIAGSRAVIAFEDVVSITSDMDGDTVSLTRHPSDLIFR